MADESAHVIFFVSCELAASSLNDAQRVSKASIVKCRVLNDQANCHGRKHHSDVPDKTAKHQQWML